MVINLNPFEENWCIEECSVFLVNMLACNSVTIWRAYHFKSENEIWSNFVVFQVLAHMASSFLKNAAQCFINVHTVNLFIRNYFL